MYDAKPATFFGIMPRLGFGLGGIINRYSELADKTALYLEGNFGLELRDCSTTSSRRPGRPDHLRLRGRELGYTNMVNYTTFTVGLTWFIDVVPAEVRAAHWQPNSN